jgi:hypothetical protein
MTQDGRKCNSASDATIRQLLEVLLKEMTVRRGTKETKLVTDEDTKSVEFQREFSTGFL